MDDLAYLYDASYTALDLMDEEQYLEWFRQELELYHSMENRA